MTYDESIMGGKEVQWMKIDLPIYKGIQFFMIKCMDWTNPEHNQKMPDIVLINPCDFPNQIMRDTITAYIIDNLAIQGKLQVGGRYIV